jgi:hypothetical protein
MLLSFSVLQNRRLLDGDRKREKIVTKINFMPHVDVARNPIFLWSISVLQILRLLERERDNAPLSVLSKSALTVSFPLFFRFWTKEKDRSIRKYDSVLLSKPNRTNLYDASQHCVSQKLRFFCWVHYSLRRSYNYCASYKGKSDAM